MPLALPAGPVLVAVPIPRHPALPWVLFFNQAVFEKKGRPLRAAREVRCSHWIPRRNGRYTIVGVRRIRRLCIAAPRCGPRQRYRFVIECPPQVVEGRQVLVGSRRFPPPWEIEDNGACFIVRDASGQALSYVYYEADPGRRTAAGLLTKDEARRIAANIAKIPEYRRGGVSS